MKKIEIKDINPHGYPIDSDQLINLTALLKAVNAVQKEYGTSLIITSGLRSKEDQQRINPKAPKSKHLLGAAVDLSDPDLAITKFLKQRPELMEKEDFYCEDGNKNWVHLQILPPKSKKRWFLP